MAEFFDDILLPMEVAYATSAASAHRTQIIETASGFEYRNSPWQAPRRLYRFAGGPQKLDVLLSLKQFFDDRRGRLHGFLLDDWSDNQSANHPADVSATDQPLWPLDDSGTLFALQKNYVSGPRILRRRIIKPVVESLQLARGEESLAINRDYQLDPKTGVVRLMQALQAGETLTAGFHFHVPVRFDSDELEITRLSDEIGQVAPVPMIELKLAPTNGLLS